jgi:short-subunit dehydrogenase
MQLNVRVCSFILCIHNSVEFLPADLADLNTVKSAALSFLALQLPLHLLINNGMFGMSSTLLELQSNNNMWQIGLIFYLITHLFTLSKASSSFVANCCKTKVKTLQSTQSTDASMVFECVYVCSWHLLLLVNVSNKQRNVTCVCY